MTLRTTMNLTQKQMLVMTPRLQQAIKILQMPRLELAQYISQQLRFIYDLVCHLLEANEDAKVLEYSDHTA